LPILALPRCLIQNPKISLDFALCRSVECCLAGVMLCRHGRRWTLSGSPSPEGGGADVPIIDSHSHQELAPDCTWDRCSLFDLATGRSIQLRGNGHQERFFLVSGAAVVSGPSTLHELAAPSPVPVRPQRVFTLTASKHAILMRLIEESKKKS
jgi:hypothetical protein